MATGWWCGREGRRTSASGTCGCSVSRLEQLGLDWDAPPYEPLAPQVDSPIRIEVDLGELAEKK